MRVGKIAVIILGMVSLMFLAFNVGVQVSHGKDFKTLAHEVQPLLCPLHANIESSRLQASANGTMGVRLQTYSGMDLNTIIGLLEMPFLLIAVFFAFRTANSLKGGVFGSGMNLIAWGALVMAIGHLHLQLQNLFDFNLFAILVGDVLGFVVWVVALVITWGLTGAGFYSIYKASKVG